MALLHLDGCTAYRAREDLDSVGYVRQLDASNLTINEVGGHGGLGSIVMGSFGATGGNSEFYLAHTATEDLVFGCYLKYVAFDVSGGDIKDMIFSFRNSTTSNLSIHLHQDGTLTVWRSQSSAKLFDSADVLQTADGAIHSIPIGGSVRIEFRYHIDNSPDGEIELRVDGILWGHITGIDTQQSGTSCNRWYMHTNDSPDSGAHFEVSDIYLIDKAGTQNTTFLGGGARVQVIRPDAEAAGIAFTPETGTDNSAMVDDAPKHDHDGSYNDSTGDAQVDRFTSTDVLAGALVDVKGVNVVNVARHTGVAQNFRNVIFEGATAGNGSDEALSVDFSPYVTLHEVNPDTSAQWTQTEVEAAEFGYESRA